ncbi:MAG TPA: monovalent cation/H(+) antiporter subunit G [Streptosporangiaceae bacterium]|nr:monovalent cation/H(+) antiporter subunit G [Streptosporangiaceae bacterium]
MIGVLHGLVIAFYAAGLAVVVLACLGALLPRPVFTRLHFLTPVTSAGAPLIGVALAIQNGWGLTSGLILLIVVLLAMTGPVLAAATARVSAERDGLIEVDSPR